MSVAVAAPAKQRIENKNLPHVNSSLNLIFSSASASSSFSPFSLVSANYNLFIKYFRNQNAFASCGFLCSGMYSIHIYVHTEIYVWGIYSGGNNNTTVEREHTEAKSWVKTKERAHTKIDEHRLNAFGLLCFFLFGVYWHVVPRSCIDKSIKCVCMRLLWSSLQCHLGFI